MLSTDGGENWRVILKRVKYPNFQWGHQSDKGTTNLGKIPKASILAVYHRNTKSAKGLWDPEFDFVTSDDFFNTKRVLVKGGNNFILSGRMIFCARALTQAPALPSLRTCR